MHRHNSRGLFSHPTPRAFHFLGAEGRAERVQWRWVRRGDGELSLSPGHGAVGLSVSLAAAVPLASKGQRFSGKKS